MTWYQLAPKLSYEFEEIEKGIRVRAIQMDIPMMRSDNWLQRTYRYCWKKSTTPMKIHPTLLLTPIVESRFKQANGSGRILRHFKGFSHFNEMIGMIQRLEDKVSAAKTKGKCHLMIGTAIVKMRLKR